MEIMYVYLCEGKKYIDYIDDVDNIDDIVEN
jgi:hypothetical protein